MLDPTFSEKKWDLVSRSRDEGRKVRGFEACGRLLNLNRSCGSFLVALGEADFKDSILVGGFGGSRVDQVW